MINQPSAIKLDQDGSPEPERRRHEPGFRPERVNLARWLSLAALIAAGVLIWSLRHVLVLMFTGIVLAMALCTLVGQLQALRPMPPIRPRGVIRPWGSSKTL